LTNGLEKKRLDLKLAEGEGGKDVMATRKKKE
jgi:hypothetical protein